MIVELADDVREDLRVIHERLHGLTEGLFRDEAGGLVWGVPAWVVKAYVWAVYQGLDPLLPCLEAHYGKRLWGTGQDRPDWPGWAEGRAWVRRCASFRLNIPTAAGRAAP